MNINEPNMKFDKAGIYFKDKIFMDETVFYMSTYRFNDEFKTYSERFEMRNGKHGYVLDDLKLVRAGPETKTIDFGELWDVLRSKDHSLLDSASWMFDKDCEKYLDMKSERSVDKMGQKISYSTFPRCGNSFLRKYLQLVTGIATGSDMPIEAVIDMQMNYFKGEEITDSSVWIFKSHDPMPIKGRPKVKANKVLVCVRNPFDTMTS